MTTPRAYWKLAPLAGAFLFLVSLPVHSPWLAVLACGVVVLPFVVPLKSSFRLQRQLPARAVVGSPLPCVYAITNTGRMSSPPLVLADPIPGFAPAALAVPPLRPGESASLELPLHPIARSWTDASWQVVIRQSGWFAGASNLLHKPMRGAPIVRPRLLPLPGAMPLLSLETIGHGVVRVGEGTDVHSVRPWQPGDASRSVHWRSTARVGSPMVLERSEEYSRELMLVVADGGAGPAWEDGVSRAAWVARTAAQEGCAVRVYAGPGARPLPLSPTPDDIQDWFAGLLTVGSVDLLPIAELLRRSRATGAIALLTASPSLAPALAQIAPRVRIVELMTR